MTRYSVLVVGGAASCSIVADELFSMAWIHLAVLRKKIGNLRSEIAQLQELNDRYWLRGRNDTQEQLAHGQRHERLQEIQQELSQLADLGRRVRSLEQHRSRPYLVNKAS